jgi:hypothetical protein
MRVRLFDRPPWLLLLLPVRGCVSGGVGELDVELICVFDSRGGNDVFVSPALVLELPHEKHSSFDNIVDGMSWCKCALTEIVPQERSMAEQPALCYGRERQAGILTRSIMSGAIARHIEACVGSSLPSHMAAEATSSFHGKLYGGAA